MMRELCKVTFQTRQFFRHVSAISEEGNFLQHTFVVAGNRQPSLLNPIEKRRAIPFDHVGMQRANLFQFFPNRFQAMNQILGQMFALALSHFD